MADLPTGANRPAYMGKSGYQLYLRDQMYLLKATHTHAVDRLRVIVEQWKALPEAERNTWNATSKDVNNQ